jgi:hypothetical protein
MIRTEIYVENNRIDLEKDLSSEFTYNVDDVKDFAAKNTSFSKTIILPGNANNNKIFGHIFQFGSANFYNSSETNIGYNYNAAKSAACIIYVDKIQIFKGVLRILEITIDNGSIEYECAVFGELGGFISKLGNAKLEELNFSAYDHVWNVSNIQNSWNNIDGDGYYYPLIDYGNVSARNNKLDYKVDALRPALYVREYIDKIITGAGYTYESSFFNSAVFRRLIIPNNQKTLSGYSTSGLQVYASVSAYVTNNYTIPIAFGYKTLMGYFTANAQDTEFTYTNATPLNCKLSFSLQANWESPYQGTVKVKKNGAVIYSNYIGYGNTYAYFYASTVIDPITINQNDILKVDFEVSGSMGNNVTLDVWAGNIILTTDATQLVPIGYGETVSMNGTLPKGIFQRDFFSSILKMFNIYVVEDQNKTNHLILKPYIEFYDNGIQLLAIDDFNDLLKVNLGDYLLLHDPESTSLDWSYKVDRSKPIKLKPMSELNGRYFEYKYRNDTDYYNDQYQKKYSQSYGTRIEDTGYEFAKDKQTAEVIFSPTPLVGYTGRDKIVSTIFKLNNDVEDVTEHNIRILQAKKIDGINTWNIRNQTNTGNLATLTSYGYAGHLDDPDAPEADLNFGVPGELYFTLATDYPNANLFNAYWSDYIAEISDKDSKLMTCNIYLTTKDIYSLDFAHLIYIDGTLFRLNSIQDFNPIDTDTTKAEFLKVIELTYT